MQFKDINYRKEGNRIHCKTVSESDKPSDFIMDISKFKTELIIGTDVAKKTSVFLRSKINIEVNF